MRRLLAAILCLVFPALAFADSDFGLNYSSGAFSVQCSNIVNGSTTLQGFSLGNLSTTAAVITFFDIGSSLATSTAKSYSFLIPGSGASNQGGGSNAFPARGLNFVSGLSFCVTPAPASSALTAGQVLGTIFYH